MKKIITILLILFTLTTFGQDKELFDYINQYRVVNNKKSLKWSDKLVKISVGQNNKNIKTNSLTHSTYNSYENCLRGYGIANTLVKQKQFTKFAKKYFKYTYIVGDDLNKDQLNKLTKMYMVYIWHTSPGHRKNMLRNNVKFCSAESSIGDDYKFVNGVFKFGDKTYKYKIVSSHYEILYYATMNIK